jgi:hypothetical protein
MPICGFRSGQLSPVGSCLTSADRPKPRAPLNFQYEVDALRRSREKVFQAPPVEWINDRLETCKEVLQTRTGRSAKGTP